MNSLNAFYTVEEFLFPGFKKAPEIMILSVMFLIFSHKNFWCYSIIFSPSINTLSAFRLPC